LRLPTPLEVSLGLIIAHTKVAAVFDAWTESEAQRSRHHLYLR